MSPASAVFSPTTLPQQRRKGRGLANKKCVYENCDVSICEQRNALTKVALGVQAYAARIWTEEVLTLEELVKEQVADSNSQATVWTVGHPMLCYANDSDANFM